MAPTGVPLPLDLLLSAGAFDDPEEDEPFEPDSFELGEPLALEEPLGLGEPLELDEPFELDESLELELGPVLVAGGSEAVVIASPCGSESRICWPAKFWLSQTNKLKTLFGVAVVAHR